MNDIGRFFPGRYGPARQSFLSLARTRGLDVSCAVLPGHAGADGEDLAMDAVLAGPANARGLVVVSSAVHGAEGHCGSGCQQAMLEDDDLFARLARQDVAMLLVHAVNPYGFSHTRRVNEDGVDLNRNLHDFARPLPRNDGYVQIHDLLLPSEWPPTQSNAQAIAAWQGEHGARAWQQAASGGQHTHPSGLFYGGAAPTWSNRTLRELVRRFGAGRRAIAWVDLHTGLGPSGHGEKIFAGTGGADELARARRCWGADVFDPSQGDSVSARVTGPVAQSVFEECPGVPADVMGLEFGTLSMPRVINALRADHWLALNPRANPDQRNAIKRDMLDAFYIDDLAWKAMVIAQARVAVIQAIAHLATA